MPKRISERALLFLTATFCFVFSSLADNITATLVSITLILSLQLDRAKTIKFATTVVFAVNSGGVALITGDVTTLMIFLAGKVAILQLLALAVPAFVAVMVLAAMLSIGMKGEVVVQGPSQRCARRGCGHRADLPLHHSEHHHRQLPVPDSACADLPRRVVGDVHRGALLQ